MEKLGIEPTQLLAQVINFLILFVVLAKFLYKPILKVLDQRKKAIEESLANSQRIKEELDRLEEDKKKILKEVREEGLKILDEEKRSAQEKQDEILAKADEEAQKILAKADERIKAREEEMMAAVKKRAVEVGSDIAKKILEDLDEETKRKIVISSLKKL